MRNCEAYQAICRKAEEIGWPVCYQADLLYHDHERLCSGDAFSVPEGSPFAWVARETGTDMFVPHYSGDRINLVDIEGKRAKHNRAFWWDGQRLTEIPVDAIRTNLYIAERHDESGYGEERPPVVTAVIECNP